MKFSTLDLGLIDYKDAYEVQKDLINKLKKKNIGHTLIVCHHPPVVTLGKKSEESDITYWRGPVYHIERGGKATYHGPGQCIVYPIINLREFQQNIAGLLNAIEDAIIKSLDFYQVTSSGNPQRGNPNSTGVWVSQKKIASIGMAIKSWITYHGLAINLYNDPQAFYGINPCGMQATTMTDLETQLNGHKVNRLEFQNILIDSLITNLEKIGGPCKAAHSIRQ